MAFTAIHMLSLAVTLAAVVGLGIYSARRVRTAADFCVGGRKAGPSMVFGTIIGTIIGGSATIGTAQMAFSVGISALWFTMGCGLALVIIALFYAKPLRSSGLETIPQYLAVNYGSKAGPITSITGSIGIFFSVVANLMSAVPLLGAVFQLSAGQASVAALVVVAAYVFFGGVRGTGLIGILKSVLIAAGLLAVAYLSCRDMGGVDGFRNAFPTQPWFNIFGRGIWVDFGGLLSLLVGTISTQTYIQAIYSASDIRAARQGAIAAALVTIPAGIPAVMAGMFMRANHPGIDPIDALPLYIVSYLPPWLGGIAIGGLLLACIGSAAGLSLGVGTMISRDIFGGVFGWKGDQRLLWLNRVIVLLVSGGAALFTFGNLRSMVLEWNFLSMGLRGAGVFLPLTFAVFAPQRIRPAYGLWSMGIGVAVMLGWKLFVPAGLDPLYAGLSAAALVLAGGMCRGPRASTELS